MGDAVRQGIDVAVGTVAVTELAREPVLGNAAIVAGQELEDAPDQARMLAGADVAIIGNLAGVPEQRDLRMSGSEPADCRHRAQASPAPPHQDRPGPASVLGRAEINRDCV